MTDDLIGFLRDRLDVDEQVAREATASEWRNAPTSSHYEDAAGPSEAVFASSPDTGLIVVARTGAHGDRAGMVNAEHIARWSPARVLAEVAAKRRIMARHRPLTAADDMVKPEWYGSCDGCGPSWNDERHTPTMDDCPELRDLASIYSDHPYYRREWTP